MKIHILLRQIYQNIFEGGLGLLYLMPFATIFQFISWLSVLLVEETRVHGVNHRPFASHRQILSGNVVSSTPRHGIFLKVILPFITENILLNSLYKQILLHVKLEFTWYLLS